jgi:two-component system alkaline phosphatase synthesis response regulator PhoP/two-component system response regulator VicR
MGKRILVVEDDSAVARLLQVNLEAAGYEVAWAADGREALARVAGELPDLIVLDVMMPVMDGFEVLRRLKGDLDTADVPVVMLTAKADEQSIFEGWAEGVHCYLTKPFDPGDLLLFIGRLMATEDEAADGGSGLPLEE